MPAASVIPGVMKVKPEERKLYYSLAALLAIASIGILQLPLFNYLGYEYSVAIACLTPILAGAITWRVVRSRRTAGGGVPEYRSIARDATFQSLSLLVLPFLIGTLNGVFVRNCALGEGALYFMLIPVVTTIWSVGLMLFCLRRFRWPLFSFIAVLVVVLLHPFYIGYALPQIYTYNFIYGFFQGFSYDEVLSMTPTVVLFRIVTSISALFFYVGAEAKLGYADQRRTSLSDQPAPPKHRLLLVVLATVLIASWIFRVQLGFESTTASIKSELVCEFTSDHFRIHYADSSFSENEIQIVAAMHEFRLSQVERALQVNFPGVIESYIYPSAESKRKFIGTGNTNIAKPWRGEIHLNFDSWDATLRHELAHVVAGEFGMPLIRAHYNIGLVEGLATAVDREFGNRTLMEYAAAMKKFSMVEHPERLINPVGFAMQNSTVSYVEMGAFCEYLINQYGIGKFKQLYGTSFGSALREFIGGRTVAEDVYGKSYKELIDEWQSGIDTMSIPSSWRPHAAFYFKRPSIFAKECARVVANLNEEGFRQLDSKNPAGAMVAFQNALETSWNTEAYVGLIRSAFRAELYDTVITMMRSQLRDSAGRSSVANLFLLYGDALWYKGDTLAARAAYDDLLALDLTPRYNEAALSRLHVLDDPAIRDSMSRYFVGAMTDSASYRFLLSLERRSDNPILPYLKARLLFRSRKYARVIDQLETISVPLGVHALEAARLQILGEAYFHRKDYATAREHFQRSRQYITNKATSDQVLDAIERCNWYETGRAQFSSR